MPFDKKAWQREYMAAYRRGERRARKTLTQKPVRQPVRLHVETPTPTPVEPKAIYPTLPVLTRTHRFEIRAEFITPISPASLEKVVVKRRGLGGRIEFGEVVLANSVIELHKRAARIYSTRELEGLDPEQIKGMKDALTHACIFRGVRLVPEGKWHIGEHSHTTMEEDALNEALAPLGIKGVGDNNYNIFKDDGSHPDQVETAGKENWTGTNLLYHVLFRLPIENAEAFRKYGENIEQHLSVLTKMGEGIDRLTAAVGKLERKPPTTKDRLGKRQWGQGWKED